MLCISFFSAPPGFVIDLFFKEKFSIEETDGCKFDYIEFRDGPFGYSKFIARFCGEGFPVSILTESRFLWTRFESDDLVQFPGFRAVYEYRKAAGTSLFVKRNFSGVLKFDIVEYMYSEIFLTTKVTVSVFLRK